MEVGNDNNEGKGKPVAVSGASHHPIGYENTRMAVEHFDQAIEAVYRTVEEFTAVARGGLKLQKKQPC
ncbi:MAG: hypothetical protein IRD7MM_00070 [Candidatus Midichloria mitochondrii]|uniref:hypothetical protein n=1 Tax=Candidatus Midichloria mitochondrii TaxID=234827 RepID=UPI0003075EF0|nr:hypothetical protein [Candidatus Midichloria mitochondrii]MDJ1256277.1 hypothetical protein [Candidatus Midichloria mitochondrii]MDJ1288329.1 hypothetical protein [Candidatus Midichloria mitochondrii]MDJ1298819.1 hypothetical protein [Candidatus Midichloria mitochondrii]MDJ1313025.1 hypothetical protein [Candidatus Midichloria mitochondrii]MDJ1583580.1 hypothetical protein [Candidatus Midichloria mitochondrii]